MDFVVPSEEPQDHITVTTSAEIIYHRRVRLLDLAGELDNVSAACTRLRLNLAIHDGIELEDPVLPGSAVPASNATRALRSWTRQPERLQTQR